MVEPMWSDPWNTALIFTVKAGMVTLQNFRQTGPNTFEADDLPMMGKVVFNHQPNGTLQGVVQGAMGEAKYALVPTDYATVGDGSSGGGDGNEVVDPAPSMHTYRLHVSRGHCSGKKLTRKKYNGHSQGLDPGQGERSTDLQASQLQSGVQG